MGVEERLRELGLTLPAAAAPVASYVPTVRMGNLLHVAGQLPVAADGTLIKGCLGRDCTVEEGHAAAERVALMILAQAKAALSGLDRIRRLVKMNVYVASTPEFTDQPEVANGASDLMVKVLGEAGKHARAAVGVPVLPRGVVVEIDAIFEVE